MFHVHDLPFLALVSLLPQLPGGVAGPSGHARARDGFLAEATGRIASREYALSLVPGESGVWSAPNRSQKLRLRVSSVGAEVFPRSVGASGEGSPWTLRLGTRALGRDELVPLQPGRIAVDGPRAELARAELLEWFVNDASGIEQGWTIAIPPPGAGPLRVVLAVEGDLVLRIDEGGRSGVFVAGDGEQRAAYRDLHAWDAGGRELDARLAPGPDGVEVLVDDAGAAYPVTIDPLLTDPSWNVVGGQNSGLLGSALAPAGDVNADGYSDVIVGAPDFDLGEIDEGAAFVFHGGPDGLEQNPSWVGTSDQAGARFGNSVGLAGDVNGDGYSDVIVGAPLFDDGQTDEGAAFVFHGSAGGIQATAAWSAFSNQAGAQFGASVSTAGDVNGDGRSDVVVGSPGYERGHTDEGRVFVYHGSSGGLATSFAWLHELDQVGARFGASVSTAGDVDGDGYDDVILGAPRFDDTQVDEGAAFVFNGGSGGLRSTPLWTTVAGQAGAHLGEAVATAGDVDRDGYADVIVGAPNYDAGAIEEGAAFVYLGAPTGPAPFAAWSVTSGQSTAHMGHSVSTAGDVNGDGYSDVVVGAPEFNGAFVNDGLAVVFQGSPTGLSTTPVWQTSSDQAGSSLGFAVSTAGDVNRDGYADVLVGAPLYDASHTDAGLALLYNGVAAGLGGPEAWWLAEEEDEALGTSVACVGDVDGDGASEVAFGAPFHASSPQGQGRVIVYAQGSLNLWTIESTVDSERFGSAVSGAGDVNGDGYADLLVGAPNLSNGETSEGRVYVFHGTPFGPHTAPDWTAEPDQAFHSFGASLSTAGDVNGDGYSDVLVGAPGWPGRAYVFLGSPQGLAQAPAWTFELGPPNRYLGFSVSTAGDVNGDGYSDVVLGAPGPGSGPGDEGMALVFHGSPVGLKSTPAWSWQSTQAADHLGFSVSTAGDVNGDGYSDVLVGAPGASTGGHALVFLGSAGGLGAAPAWTGSGPQTGEAFGGSVSTAGDVNADGYSDVLVGAPSYHVDIDLIPTTVGRASLVFGSASGLAPGPGWSTTGVPDAPLGSAVSTAGDVNADGYSDVVLGVPGWDVLAFDGGTAFGWYGNEGAGSPVRGLRQLRLSLAPLALLGFTPKSGQFHLGVDVEPTGAGLSWAHPAATQGLLEWEVTSIKKPFDGLGTGSLPIGPLFPSSATTGLLAFVQPELPSGPKVLPASISFRWRARLVTDNPLYPVSPWFSMGGNAITEAKLRRVIPLK